MGGVGRMDEVGWMDEAGVRRGRSCVPFVRGLIRRQTACGLLHLSPKGKATGDGMRFSHFVGAGALDGPFTKDIRLAARQASAGKDICPVRQRRFAARHVNKVHKLAYVVYSNYNANRVKCK